jgi:hypothetical protein
MKTKSIFVWLFAMSIILTSCCKMEQEVTPSANITTQKKSIVDFSKLDVSDLFTVYVSISDEESVSVEANDNLHPYISVNKYGDKLVVQLADNINIKKGEATLNVHISMRDLNMIKGAGAVKFELENELAGQELQLDLSGASALSGYFNLELLDVSLTGASRLDLSGHSNRFIIDASGASFVKDFSFGANQFRADLDGASEFHLTVHESMDIIASGASVIYYRGNAQINSQNLSGASRIVKLD